MKLVNSIRVKVNDKKSLSKIMKSGIKKMKNKEIQSNPTSQNLCKEMKASF